MQCPRCNALNPEYARFCMECGEKLAAKCAQCAAELPPNAKFCLECGGKVVAGEKPKEEANFERLIPREYAERLRRSVSEQPANERRLVTILFSDIKGSTALAERMDPEEVLEIINGAFEALITPIYKHEGTLARLMGDAILAFFGAPVAHEDDPQRAVRAALEIQAGVQEYANQLARERGITGFSVRVGINTGMVIVGEVGSDLRVEYTAIGDAINTAARMEQNAPVGGILISQDTYQHVRGLFETEAQPPLTVKGKSNPIQTYVVESVRSRVGLRAPERGIEGLQTPLVGRETELLWLRNIYQDALQESQTHLVTVVGEAGVGKSRLLDEFVNQCVADSGVCTLFGRGAPESQSQGFGLWRSLFSAYLEIQESDSAAQVSERFRRELAPELLPGQAEGVARLLGFETNSGLADGGSLEIQGQDCIEDFFRSITPRRPALVILDDIHWADAASLSLVDRLVTALPDRRLLFLCLARPALYETRPHWGEGRECYERLDLRPLSRRNTRHLLGHLLPTPTPELEETLLKSADGNPYYTEELARMCLDLMARGEGSGPSLLAHIPSTLTGVLQARLETLSASEKTVLQQASVVGREFWDVLLTDLTLAQPEKSAQAVTRHLESLRNRAMVEQRERSSFSNANEYTFKHAVLQETVYETILLKQRKQYHAQVAAWLEEHAGDRASEYWPRIAAHYERAGQPEKAADFWQKAAENAQMKDIFDEAERSYRRVLALLPADSPDLADEIRLRRARILVELGSFVTDKTVGEADLKTSLLISAQIPGQAALALTSQAYRNLGLKYFFEDDAYQKGWEYISQALEFARQSGSALEIAESLAEQAILLVFQRNLPEAENLFRESVASYRRHTFTSLREASTTSYDPILLILIRLEKRRGHEEAAKAYSDELLEFVHKNTHGLQHPLLLSARYKLALVAGDDKEAEAVARQLLRIAEETGERGLWAGASENTIQACLAQGLIAEAEAVAQRMLEQVRKWQNLSWERNALYHLTRIAQARKDWQTGQAWLSQALQIDLRHAKGDPNATHLPLLSYAGHFYAAQGDWGTANQYFHRILTFERLENAGPDILNLLVQLAEPLSRINELELLAELVGALESMPMLYTPWNERTYIAPVCPLLNLDEPAQAAAYQRGLEQGAMPLIRRLTDLFAPK
ncbi:MAG: AAA family ATPase [Anaerolineae bacterium]|nr:AAA family ATPase [Anaerolineae bacterium]